MFRQLTRSCVGMQRRYTSTLPALQNDPNPTEATAVYANPLCMQMDQMIHRASTPEEVLMLLVTHRGVMFVHNLVTAASALADMSQRSIPFAQLKKFKYPGEFEKTQRDKMLEDPRYVLLVRDLIDYSGKLDLGSIEQILSALQKMDHCHYKLLGSLLRRIYSIDLVPDDVSRAISIGASLQWAGFGKAAVFYDKLSALLVPHLASLSQKDFLNSLMTFSKIPKFYPEIYVACSNQLIERAHLLDSPQIGISAIAISEYGDIVPEIQPAVHALAEVLAARSDNVALRDVVRGAIALRRSSVSHPKLLNVAIEKAMKEIVDADRLGEGLDPSVSSISDLAQLFDSCAYFGVAAPPITDFLEKHVDVITEESAIRFLSFFSVFPKMVTPVSVPLVSLLIRKIGSTSSTSWEKHKSKLAFSFFSKCMYFPHIDSEIRKFILDRVLDHYLVSRRGYGVPYPDEARLLFDAVVGDDPSNQSVFLFNEWIPNSPYNADILIPSQRVAVLVLSKFDTLGNPVGTDLIQTLHVRSLGWKVICVDRRNFSEFAEKIRLVVS